MISFLPADDQQAGDDGARNFAAAHFAQALLQIRKSERNAAGVGIEHHGAFGHRALHQEMAGKAHALQRQADAAPHFHVEHG